MTPNRFFTILWLVILIASLFATGERLIAGATQPALLSGAIAVFSIIRLALIYREERQKETAARPKQKRK